MMEPRSFTRRVARALQRSARAERAEPLRCCLFYIVAEEEVEQADEVESPERIDDPNCHVLSHAP